jgi:N-acetyl-alpha-D-muramate 1-phosphate uridylyltransferase
MLPCAILCGGLATRLRPATEKIPKSLMPINGEPFIAHQLRLLRAHGITRIVLCAGYLGEMIKDFVGNVEMSFDGPQLLGTAGAIRKALPMLGPSFFVLYGDSYLPCDYASVASAFTASNKPGLMTIYRNAGQFDKSNVEADGERIIRYEKGTRNPAMQHIDYGLGVFERSVFEELPANEPHDLAEVYQNLLSRGQLAAFEIKERFYEIGSQQGIRQLELYLSRSS